MSSGMVRTAQPHHVQNVVGVISPMMMSLGLSSAFHARDLYQGARSQRIPNGHSGSRLIPFWLPVWRPVAVLPTRFLEMCRSVVAVPLAHEITVFAAVPSCLRSRTLQCTRDTVFIAVSIMVSLCLM